jgi:ATP-dependent DNA helicase 2 subunit 2
LLNDIRTLQDHLKPSKTNEGDCEYPITNEKAKLISTVLSALAVAVQQIDVATQGTKGNPLKYERRIIIVTDGRGTIDTDDLDQIAAKINDKAAPVDVTLLGVDFDDPENGYKEEDKDAQKVRILGPKSYIAHMV